MLIQWSTKNLKSALNYQHNSEILTQKPAKTIRIDSFAR